jgi:tetratricopeptide (TPR) repeat protein
VKIREAINYYITAVSLNEDPVFLHNLGWMYYITGKDSSLQCFKRAIRIEPNIALYHISLGLVYEKRGQLAAAIEEYQIAIRLSPDIADSDFFKSLEDRSPATAQLVLTKAREYLEEFYKKNPDPKVAARLAKIYLNSNNIPQALALFKDVTSQLPSLNRPHLYLGDIYAQQGDTSGMLKCYYQSARIDYFDYLPDLRLSSYYYKIRNFTEATHFFTSAREKWARIVSENAIRATRSYYLNKFIYNDVVPQSLLNYIKPTFTMQKEI